MTDISAMVGLTLASVVNDNYDKLIFTAVTGERFEMYHSQDCCESVYLEDVVGDLNSLVGVPILSASEESSYDSSDYDVQEWTFFKIATINGHVDLRWYGTSNGYYSTSVSFQQVA